jgi:hypothetical protein
MLDEHVRPGEDLGFVSVVPSHEVGRRSVLAEHPEDLGVALRLPLMMSPDDQAIARLRSQHGVI